MKRFSLDDAEDHISERAVSDGARMVPAGTVFIVVRGMILAHTFPVCIAERSMSFNQDVKALVPQPGVDGRFLAHWLHGNHHKLLGLVTEATHGTKRLDLRDLQATEVLLPSLPEQRRIAEVLDTLDEAIRKTEHLIAKLKQLKQGLLYDLLTRGIDDNGELRDPERHPEQFKDSDLGRIPRGWNVSRMEDLTSRIVDGVHRTPTYVEAGIPFLTVENLTRGPSISFEPCRFVSIAAHREYFRRADPQAGDVLVSKDGTLGVARVVPPGLPEFSIFVSVAILRPRLDLIVPALIETFFDTPLFQRQLGTQSAGTGLKHIHLEHFREFRIAVPSLAEQARIFEAVGGLRVRLTTEGSTLVKLRRLKCGLMDDLLTGRVRVTSLHNDAAA